VTKGLFPKTEKKRNVGSYTSRSGYIKKDKNKIKIKIKFSAKTRKRKPESGMM
jgi:hypothetical protein